MRRSSELPTPTDLQIHPELATMAILDATLQVTILALVAVHPELGEADLPHDPDTTLANAIVNLAGALSDLIAAYEQWTVQADRTGLGHAPF